VRETRLFSTVNEDIGICKAKKILNALHVEMAQERYTEIHVHQVENLITVQRHCTKTHKAVCILLDQVIFVVNKIDMIAHTAFYRNAAGLSEAASVIKIPAKIDQTVIAAKLSVPQQEFVNVRTYSVLCLL
jgi:hypothetical protein